MSAAIDPSVLASIVAQAVQAALAAPGAATAPVTPAAPAASPVPKAKGAVPPAPKAAPPKPVAAPVAAPKAPMDWTVVQTFTVPNCRVKLELLASGMINVNIPPNFKTGKGIGNAPCWKESLESLQLVIQQVLDSGRVKSYSETH